MDARKKAGASGALPRERVAEIAKASKGPTADKTIADSDEREGGPQEKEMVTRWPKKGFSLIDWCQACFIIFATLRVY